MVESGSEGPAAIERARSARQPYRDALWWSRRSHLKLGWFYAIAWPALLSFVYGAIALAKGDLRDGAPAIGVAIGLSLIVASVVAAITLPMRRRAALLEPFAAKIGGLSFRGPRPDRVLAWLDRHWSGEVPTSLIHDPTGTAYYIGVEATVGNDDVLIVGLRPTFWPRVRLAVFFAASGALFALDPQAEVWLAEQGYVVSRSAHGVLLARDRAPRSAFHEGHLQEIVHAVLSGARAAAADRDRLSTRARLRMITVRRWQPVMSFSDRDLQLNGRGLLTGRQRLRCAAWGLGALALSVFSGGWTVSTAMSGRPDSSRFSDGLGVVVCGLITLVLAGYALVSLWDALDGHAAMIVGPLRHSKSVGYKGGVTHHLTCASHSFRVPASCEFAIEAGVPYRVYFARHSSRLLSLERADLDPETR